MMVVINYMCNFLDHMLLKFADPRLMGQGYVDMMLPNLLQLYLYCIYLSAEFFFGFWFWLQALKGL